MQLVIGNKNYSSWSMRPWLLLVHFGIPFEERMIRFDSFTADSGFRRAADPLSPSGKVPVLVESDGFTTWDTLAIAERLADLHPQHPIWPQDARLRGRARALAATMHSGFGDLRRLCPMNIDADLGAVGRRLLATEPGLQADLHRLARLWTPELQAQQGPFLMGEVFCAADAFFAPVAMRVTRYALPLPAACSAYVEALCALPALQRWVSEAEAEKDFVAEDEPYRKSAGEVPR